MTQPQDTRHSVRLDLYTLQQWGLEGSGYSARLVGEVDDAWADSFRQAQHTRGDTARFYLDRKQSVLVFSTGAGEDPQKMLEEARALIELANRRAGRLTRPSRDVPADSSSVENSSRATPATPLKRSQQQRLEDTRGSSRVDASLMVQFHAEGEVETGAGATGMTHDLSKDGVFVVTNRLPSVGERLNLTVYVAAKDRIEVMGQVVRVLDKDEAFKMQRRAGFAARVSDPSGKYSLLVTRGQG